MLGYTDAAISRMSPQGRREWVEQVKALLQEQVNADNPRPNRGLDALLDKADAPRRRLGLGSRYPWLLSGPGWRPLSAPPGWVVTPTASRRRRHDDGAWGRLDPDEVALWIKWSSIHGASRGAWVEVDAPEPWRAWAKVVEVDGRELVTALVVEPGPDGLVPSSGLTAKSLQAVRVAHALNKLLTQPSAALKLSRVAARRLRGEKPPPIGTHKGEDHDAKLAIAYLQALEKDPRRPYRVMASARRGWDVRAIGRLPDQVRRVRERGWLSPTQNGVAGGSPTPRLLDWARRSSDPDFRRWGEAMDATGEE